MGDVIVVDQGLARYEIRGLRTKGSELELAAQRLRSQLEDRHQAACSVLVDLEGDVAHVFRDQCGRVHGALAVACQITQQAASTCLSFPGLGYSPFPEVPALPATNRFGTFSADPRTLRAFADASPAWDAAVLTVDGQVNLSGVTATVSHQREELIPGEPPRAMWTTPQPIDPATLVSLPDLGVIVPRVLTLSVATATLSFLTALAVSDADTLPPLPASIDRLLNLLGLGGRSELRSIPLRSFIAALGDSGGMPRAIHERQLEDYWLARGLERSGIDLDAWDPSRGAGANYDTIIQVYDYYADLYLAHPELQWAGMANMIGPSFAAGFQDLRLFRDLARATDGPEDLPVPFWAMSPQLVPLHALGTMTDTELLFYEATLLQMQQDIFVDATVMHEAYLGGGMPAIHELGRAGYIEPEDVTAWERIDRGARLGDSTLLANGNRRLLEREQLLIIDEAYHEMHDRPVTGPAMTYTMGLVGEPSIPGAPTLAQHEPATASYTHYMLGLGLRENTLGIPTITYAPQPVATLTMTTPLPAGNLANTAERWDYIEGSVLPAYQHLVDDEPAVVRQVVASPFEERMDSYRLHHRLDDIEHRLLTDWTIDARSGR